jgi:hypothetical protein
LLTNIKIFEKQKQKKTMLTKVSKNDKSMQLFRIHLHISSFSFSLSHKRDAKMTFVSQNFPSSLSKKQFHKTIGASNQKKKKERRLAQVGPSSAHLLTNYNTHLSHV